MLCSLVCKDGCYLIRLDQVVTKLRAEVKSGDMASVRNTLLILLTCVDYKFIQPAGKGCFKFTL